MPSCERTCHAEQGVLKNRCLLEVFSPSLAVHLAGTAPESSSGQKEQAQEQGAASDPDSPMLDPNKKLGPVDLETAAHDGVFNQFVANQLLSKGQRINIGSPDTYFRPAYATAAGVKSAPDAEDPSQFAKGRLQVDPLSPLHGYAKGQPLLCLQAITAPLAPCAVCIEAPGALHAHGQAALWRELTA